MNIREWIIENESLRLVVYDDATGKPIMPGSVVEGHPTIGYGRALDVKGVTPDEASFFLESDLAQAVADVIKIVGQDAYSNMTEARRGVLIDMRFQMGAAGLRRFKKMLEAVANGEWGVAADEMLASLWAKQTPNRAKKNALAMRSGVW